MNYQIQQGFIIWNLLLHHPSLRHYTFLPLNRASGLTKEKGRKRKKTQSPALHISEWNDEMKGAFVKDGEKLDIL